MAADVTLKNLAMEILKYYDVENNTVDIAAIKTVLDASGLDPIMKMMFESTLQLNNLEQNQDSCIPSIKIKFK